MEQKAIGKDFRHIVRIGGADIEGKKQVLYALRKIKGINFLFGNAICTLAKIDKRKLAGDLTDAEVEQINQVMAHPENYGMPEWILNRRIDPETGVTKHIFGPDIAFTRESDIKLMKKIKSYKGIRHAKGLPVRGQRTKSNFRRNKGKTLGVIKKKDNKAE